jgi:4-amino-4-deoxy-L-arabinose transferase-like glycosyltransferase
VESLNPDSKQDALDLTSRRRIFVNHEWIRNLIIILIFIVGLSIRLYDLTDPPLDFHETRQLASALTARGMFHQMDKTSPAEKRDIVVDFWHNAPLPEPHILERLVATTYYLIGEELLWIARIYSALFWVIGGIAVFSIAKEMSSADGAIIAAGIYLFLPYGIIASRSFQPDPLMVSMIAWAVWALYQWIIRQNWFYTIVAGALCGFAILVKAVAIFPLFCAALALVLVSFKVKELILNKQIWTIAILSVLPVGIYYLLMSSREVPHMLGTYIFAFNELLTQPYFYIRWVESINNIAGFGTLVASMLGAILIKGQKDKAMVIGLWIGYFLFGLAFPYHFITHNYYHLMIIPIIAISISPLANIVFHQIYKQAFIWKAITLVILVFTAGFQLWNTRVELARVDYRPEVMGWERLGREMPKDGKIIAITQSYGYRLLYYGWVSVQTWPSIADIKMWELSGDLSFEYDKEFVERTQGMDYFLITNFAEFESQPELKSILYERDPHPHEGYAHLIFNLSKDNPQ